MASDPMNGLVERLKHDAEWLRLFVKNNTGTTGHEWGLRARAEQHEADVSSLTDELERVREEAYEHETSADAWLAEHKISEARALTAEAALAASERRVGSALKLADEWDAYDPGNYASDRDHGRMRGKEECAEDLRAVLNPSVRTAGE